jgi:uncharacterized membrane protein YeaQ/YmgE (transglycosylase-associated protein family)
MTELLPMAEAACGPGGDLTGWIGTIIFGAVIGILARLVLPGKQNMGMLITIILGVLGALIGYWLAGLLGVCSTGGIDWIRWFISIAVAAVLVVIYGSITGRKQV